MCVRQYGCIDGIFADAFHSMKAMWPFVSFPLQMLSVIAPDSHREARNHETLTNGVSKIAPGRYALPLRRVGRGYGM